MKQNHVEVEFVVRRSPKKQPIFHMRHGNIKVTYEMTQEEMDQALQQFQLQMKHEADKV